MRFGFTAEQQDLHDAVRGLLSDACPPSVVRSAYEHGDRSDVWQRLADLGLPVALVPEDSGGLGLDDVDVVGCFEAAGEAAVPGPVVETSAVGTPLLAGAGADDIVSRIGAGEVRVTAVLDGGDLLPFPDAEFGIVNGGSSLLWARLADVDVTDVGAVDRARPLGRVDLHSSAWSVLTKDRDLIARVWHRGMVGTAAQLLGLGARMLSMTVEHVTAREQFGVPVGSFQAVKHRLADALLSLEMARPMVYAAAWAVAAGSPDAARDAAAGKAAASDAAREVAGAALQCHGAIGYTEEYDLHLWIKRSWALATAWGTAEAHRAYVARAIGV